MIALEQNIGTSQVNLRLDAGAVSFVLEDETVDVPPSCTERCLLIADMIQQDGCTSVDLPLPLSSAEVKAWLAFAREQQTALYVNGQECDEAAETLLQALKAADFLRDSTTTAALARPLLLSVLGDYPSDSEDDSDAAIPSQDERARALRIVSSVPPHCLPEILAAIDRRGMHDLPSHVPEPPPSESRYPHAQQLSRLVQLLPRSFHGAIIGACCSGACLSLPMFPACTETCPVHRAGQGIAGSAKRWVPWEERRCGPGCASILLQLLEAAAPLAGRGLERALGSEGAAQLLADASGRSSLRGAGDLSVDAVAEPIPKRLCQRGEHALEAEAAKRSSLPLPECVTIDRVRLSVTDRSPENPCHTDLPEPPQWCAALAQLRSLRAVEITVYHADYLSPVELGEALHALPALQTLHITCSHEYALESRDAPHTAMVHVLNAVCKLTQLTELALVHCFYLGTKMADDTYMNTSLLHVSQLSRLTRLTALRLVAEVTGPQGTGPLVHAVKQMKELQELNVEMDVFPVDPCEEGAEMVLQLCSATELTGLRSLGLPALRLHHRSYLSLACVHHRIQERNPSLLARLTALDLTDSYDECTHAFDPSLPATLRALFHVDAVLALLAKTPALRSLCLRCNGLRDNNSGLERLAALPCVQRLTRLRIEGNKATHKGVFAILEALACVRPSGVDGLRELDITGNTVASEHTAKLAGLLRQLRSLEVLGIAGVLATEADLKEVIGSLETLPRLRGLHLFTSTKGSCTHPGPGPGAGSLAPLLTGLRHVLIN